ncbi:MAG TPA: FKBP-type peptidyl-prolyl cis-trans isomerase [Chitinophagaceae bacterium]|nr:FKBP-type peptidyl-prolyl cis-trans isomerase [Chitinophagaceae bacterium]
MKRIHYFILVISVISLAGTTACDKISYKKTRSGLVYRLFPGGSKDSLIRFGQVIQFNVITRLNDSTLYDSHGKMPGFLKLIPTATPSYNLIEVIPLMRKGDSVITVQEADTLLRRGEQLPPIVKKGDKIKTYIRITEVFDNDSIATAVYNAEMEKDRPRMMKEQQEQMDKMEAERKEQKRKDEEELVKSGEVARELQAMDAYLKGKNIHAQKTGKGTYVTIKQQGTGPAAENGKYVSVQYTGKILRTDSVFQSNSYTFQLGMGNVIQGWDEGLLLLKEGGSATFYIPSFLAYGKNPQPGSPFKPFDDLIFDVVLKDVSDTLPAPPPPTPVKTNTGKKNN